MKSKLLPAGNKFSAVLFLTVFSLLSTIAVSQPTQEWATRYNGPGNAYDGGREIVMDDAGNIYVAGLSEGSGTALDFLTIKYNPAGVQQWAARYDGGINNNDEAWGIAIDDSGNVYVTGGSQSANNRDILTIKYNSAGVQQWVARYDGADHSYDEAFDIGVDNGGNVYVTGHSLAGVGFDAVTIKYNPAGTQQWASHYNGGGSGFDQLWKLHIDNGGNIIVAGDSDGPTTGPDYVAIKYSTGSGSNNDYATIKYSPAGTELWVKRYNGPANNRDVSWSVVVDGAGNSYITGGSNGTGTSADFATIKYSPSGNEEWVKRYTTPGNKWDEGTIVVLDEEGNVYVGGQATIGSRPDYFAIKYTPGGVEMWTASYNGPESLDDYIIAMAIDEEGEVYVSGSSEGTALGFDMATVKFSQPVSITNTSGELPGEFSLSQNYPNPFNPATNIEFTLKEDGFVSLAVYDINGRQLTELVGSTLEAGAYSVSFNAGDFPSGTYFYKLIFNSASANFTETRKMVLVK